MKMKELKDLQRLHTAVDELNATMARLVGTVKTAKANLDEIIEHATTCPRCLGGVPNNTMRGKYPGALSRTDNETYICSDCGVLEAFEQAGPRISSSGRANIMPQEEWKWNALQERH